MKKIVTLAAFAAFYAGTAHAGLYDNQPSTDAIQQQMDYQRSYSAPMSMPNNIQGYGYGGWQQNQTTRGYGDGVSPNYSRDSDSDGDE